MNVNVHRLSWLLGQDRRPAADEPHAGVRGADCVFCVIGQRVDCFRKLRVTAEKAFRDTCDITGWAHLMDGGVQLL